MISNFWQEVHLYRIGNDHFNVKKSTTSVQNIIHLFIQLSNSNNYDCYFTDRWNYNPFNIFFNNNGTDN